MYKFDRLECAVVILHGNNRAISEIPAYPEEISSSVQASWNEQTIIGRTGTIKAYTGTSDVSSSFSFDLHREMFIENVYPATSGSDPYAFENKVDALVRILKTGCYPAYGANRLDPPRTLFKFGDLYVSGIMTDFQIVWKKPIIEKSYSLCTVQISMKSADRRIIDYKDVERGEYVTTRGHMLSEDPLHGYAND